MGFNSGFKGLILKDSGLLRRDAASFGEHHVPNDGNPQLHRYRNIQNSKLSFKRVFSTKCVSFFSTSFSKVEVALRPGGGVDL